MAEHDAPESAIPQMDWQQVALNGGPPCFFIEGERFCGRAERWQGHGVAAFHDYVSLEQMVSFHVQAALTMPEGYTGEHVRQIMREAVEACRRPESQFIELDRAHTAVDVVCEASNVSHPIRLNIINALTRVASTKFGSSRADLAAPAAQGNEVKIAQEIVRAWLLTSNPHHLVEYKQQLIDRIADIARQARRETWKAAIQIGKSHLRHAEGSRHNGQRSTCRTALVQELETAALRAEGEEGK